MMIIERNPYTAQEHNERINDAINELQSIAEEINSLTINALTIVEEVDEQSFRRAEAYWASSIISNVTNEHGYIGGGSMTTLNDTIDDLRELLIDDDGEYDND